MPHRVGERIEQILENRKVSARQLGREAGIGPSTIGQFLRRTKADPDADITLKTLASIAEAAQVSLAWLVFGTGCPNDVRPPYATPKVLAAMDLARVDGIPEEALFDWQAHTLVDPSWTALYVAEDILAFMPRWAHHREQHKPPDATNVTLLDVIRRWPTRWSAKACELAQNEQPTSTTWSEWIDTMNLWERQTRRASSDELRKTTERNSA